MEQIKLSLPHQSGSERKYIDKALEDNWMVPLGPHVDLFEKMLGEYLGVENVVALSAGTAALHLALVALGVTQGDEVICQDMTFSASANPVVYCGATPIFVDSETETMNMSPEILEQAIIDRKKATGKYPKAIIPVYLYGMPANIGAILEVADRYGIAVVEDACEALGSTYKGKPCGTFGRFGAFSFNGNKIITTSGGGALICPDSETAARIKFLATQARENRPYYYHKVIGYNYRLSNISASIGCGQMEALDAHLDRRRQIHGIYQQGFADTPGVKVQDNPGKDYQSNFWLSTISLDPEKVATSPEELRVALAGQNIESRLMWRPMHLQPVFADAPCYGNGVSDTLFAHGICLPSGSSMTDSQVQRVIETIKSVLTAK